MRHWLAVLTLSVALCTSAISAQAQQSLANSRQTGANPHWDEGTPRYS
jgi:hypothetical protein